MFNEQTILLTTGYGENRLSNIYRVYNESLLKTQQKINKKTVFMGLLPQEDPGQIEKLEHIGCHQQTSEGTQQVAKWTSV